MKLSADMWYGLRCTFLWAYSRKVLRITYKIIARICNGNIRLAHKSTCYSKVCMLCVRPYRRVVLKKWQSAIPTWTPARLEWNTCYFNPPLGTHYLLNCSVSGCCNRHHYTTISVKRFLFACCSLSSD